jgi:hypothetical protein
LLDFAALVQAEDLSTEWDVETFTLSMLREGVPLELMAHEVAWGRFDGLESWCIAHGLPFTRWSGACSGQWGAERAVFTGEGAVQCYAADVDDTLLIGRCTIERLGSYAAILAHFAAGDFAVPPLRLIA